MTKSSSKTRFAGSFMVNFSLISKHLFAGGRAGAPGRPDRHGSVSLMARHGRQAWLRAWTRRAPAAAPRKTGAKGDKTQMERRAGRTGSRPQRQQQPPRRLAQDVDRARPARRSCGALSATAEAKLLCTLDCCQNRPESAEIALYTFDFLIILGNRESTCNYCRSNLFPLPNICSHTKT